MQLSQNFSLRELTKSQTAERKGISNEPSEEHVENLKLLCTKILQPIRDHFGIVSISSGYRSPALCEAIGSKITSQHASGQAADFECIGGISNYDLAVWIQGNLDFDQLILEFWEPGQNRLAQAAGMLKALVTRDTPDDDIVRHAKIAY